MSILLVNKVFYLIIISNVLKKRNLKDIILYCGYYFFMGGLIFYYIVNELDHFNVLLPLFYVSISLIGGITFVNLINKHTTKASDYLIAMFLISLSEAIIGVSFFVEKSMIYVPVCFLITYVGRYFLYKSMILKG